MLPDIYLLAIKIGIKVKKVTETVVYCDCPICEDTKGHLCIDRQKQVWRCNRCGTGGGVIGLVEQVCNADHEKAKEMIRNLDFSYIKKPHIKVEHGFEQDTPIAPIDKRNTIYRKMLSLLPLSSKHVGNLINRGLSQKAIKALNIKSTPGKINYEIPSALISSGCDLSGIPGFFIHDGKWAMFSYTQGYFIPFIQDGKIFGLQIRSDTNPKKRYIWFSSTGLDHGTKMKGNIHEISFYPGMNTVCLTEGALKADVASFIYYKLTGKTIAFIALPGVNNQKALKAELEKLKQRGVTKVIEALDMDKCGNNSVEQNKSVNIALDKVIAAIKKCGLTYVPSTWPKEKGIDDYLLFLSKKHKQKHYYNYRKKAS